jgi:oligopeptide/dipeptide ABC transporter ATP-binding protein
VLKADGLRKVFPLRGGGEVVAVDDVSFAVPPGGSLAIVGESGSGKTTIARMLVGLERPTAGRIEVVGRERTARAGLAERRRRGRELQIVFQDPYTSLDRRRRVGDAIGDVVRLHTELRKQALAERVGSLLDSVGLDESHARALPVGLSGGQRQRVAIARALAADPQVLVLDESVAALDVSIQAQILNLLARIRRETGVAYVFISHDLAVVRYLADAVAVLYLGTVVERGTVDEVFGPPWHPYTAALLAAVPVPDPDRRADGRGALDGVPPSTTAKPAGCPFAPRCPRRIGAVCETPPPQRRLSATHVVRCHLDDLVADAPARGSDRG